MLTRVVPNRHVDEHRARVTKPAKLRIVESAAVAIRLLWDDQLQSSRIIDGQRTEQHRVDQAEDCGWGPMPSASEVTTTSANPGLPAILPQPVAEIGGR